MKKLLLILLCLPMIGFGQQTYVPDNNLEQSLLIIKKGGEYKQSLTKFNEIYNKPLYFSEESNIIEIQLFNLLFSELYLTYEKVLNEKLSVKIGVPIFIKQDIVKLYQRYNLMSDEFSAGEIKEYEDLGYLSGIGIVPEFRYYFSRKEAPAGVYLSSQVIFRQFSIDISADEWTNDIFEAGGVFNNASNLKGIKFKSKLNINGIGFLIGKHWVLNSFTIDLNIGAATYAGEFKWEGTRRYLDGSVEKEKESEDIEGIDGIWIPKIGLSCGFFF